MASSRQNKGKKKMGEESSDPPMENTVKARRLTFGIRSRPLLPVKYVKFTSFPSRSFVFPVLLIKQHVYDLASNDGVVYPDLVQEFFHTFNVVYDEDDNMFMTSKVKGNEIELNMEELGSFLGIPSEGEEISHVMKRDSEIWKDFKCMDYYFSITRYSHEEILGRSNPFTPRFHRLAKTLSVSDRMLHFVLAYVLVPKDSNHSQLSDMEIMLLYAIKSGIQINWAYVFMHHLTHL